MNNGKVICFNSSHTIVDFLNMASHRLNMNAQRVFTVDGEEIFDTMMIQDEEQLFVSGGENFHMPALEGTFRPVFHFPPLFLIFGIALSLLFIHFLAGASVVGGYVIKKFLGKGSFGKVFLAEHSHTAEKVAMKFISKFQVCPF